MDPAHEPYVHVGLVSRIALDHREGPIRLPELVHHQGCLPKVMIPGEGVHGHDGGETRRPGRQQPVPADDLDGLRRVREAVAVPIAADEVVKGERSAERVIEAGAADVLVVKPMVVDGVRPASRIAAMASTALAKKTPPQDRILYLVPCIISRAFSTHPSKKQEVRGVTPQRIWASNI